MDPNETLRIARERAHDAYSKATGQEQALRDAVEHYEALDEWLSSGGFLPIAWSKVAEAARADRAERALAQLCRERRSATGKPCTCGAS